MKKVITYSLWCQKERLDKYNKNQNPNFYCQGALKNIKLQQQGIYKDWTMRFYINNTVPEKIIEEIKSLGAEVVDMSSSKIPGMYWRFLVIIDNTVDIFIVRDIDSRISLREENAVIKWIESDKCLHLMRDHPHHKYKILGGMWGFKNNHQSEKVIKIRNNFSLLLDIFLKQRNYKFRRIDDMLFLDIIYDALKGDILGHDNFFKYPDSQYFPGEGRVKHYYPYVGEIVDSNDNKPYLVRDIKLFKR